METVEGETAKGAEIPDIKARESPPPRANPSLPVSRDRLRTAQEGDPTLIRCYQEVVSADSLTTGNCKFYIQDGVLMRRWCPVMIPGADWNVETQIVVPELYRPQVLALAHDDHWSGHLGIRKTYSRVLKHFYWPGLKGDVAAHIRSCHVCQIVGKPNQKIPRAPLHPVPVASEPFEHLIMDCVGPLQRTRGGNVFLLTLMCVATRYPEAIPLRRITTRSVLKSLLKFFSTFGLPRVIQSDQGSNFTSRVFKQVLSDLNIKHVTSSAYHPESQGALERWHQTLKSMLKKYCEQEGRQWDEGIPFLLFAARKAPQESLGFNPTELVFGHELRGPLKVLKDKLLETPLSSQQNVSEYVTAFQDRLKHTRAFALEALTSSQAAMKRRHDKKAVLRVFREGDKVLALLPVTGTALNARFAGPYVVKHRLSETDYVIETPERRRKTRVCHVNMLKAYMTRKAHAPPPVEDLMTKTDAVRRSVGVTVAESFTSDNTLCERIEVKLTPRLANSEMLVSFPETTSHLDPECRADLNSLITRHRCLFNDIPSRTTAITHDIEVVPNTPIKQHPYRCSPNKRALMRQESDYLLVNGFAKPSNSPWSSPCLVESKPDGSPSFITDYRKVNALTVTDAYPLPRIDDCVDSVGSATFVTKLDMLKGYWQVPLTDRASDISAFVTPDRFLQ